MEVSVYDPLVRIEGEVAYIPLGKAGLMWPAVIVAALVLVGIALYGLSLVS